MTNAERKPTNGDRWRDVLLARVSHVSGRPDETSTGSQVDEMGVFSHANKGTVVTTFVEAGKSAYKNKARRPDLERAIKMIENGQADRLVVWKLDRWVRNVRELAKLIDRVEKAGGTFVSKCEPWCDTSNPMGYALVILVGALAEIESDNRADRARPFHNVRIKAGATPGGPRPYGYVRTRNALTIDKQEAKTIREAAKRVINGESLRGIANDFNARGIATGNEGSTWTHTLVKRVLINPTTAAHRKMADGSFAPSSVWKPILDADTWNRCRDILTDSSRRVCFDSTLQHFLSGALVCGKATCGGTMRHTPHTKGPRYRCATCGHSITATDVEDYVTASLMSMVSEDEWDGLKARGRMADRTALDRLTAKQAKAREMWLADEIDDAEWTAMQQDIKARVESLQEADALDLPMWDSLTEGWANGTPEDKRTVITTVFESITVNPRAAGVNGTQRVHIVTAPEIAA